MLQIVGCPECAAPAEIADRFTLPSTHGPVDHVVVICSAGHRYRMPAAGLASSADVARPARSPLPPTTSSPATAS